MLLFSMKYQLFCVGGGHITCSVEARAGDQGHS